MEAVDKQFGERWEQEREVSKQLRVDLEAKVKAMVSVFVVVSTHESTRINRKLCCVALGFPSMALVPLRLTCCPCLRKP